MMILCCLRELSGAKRVGEPVTTAMIDLLELLRFVSDGFTPMNEMFERAGQPEIEIYRRTKAVFEYFSFRFDQPPPE